MADKQVPDEKALSRCSENVKRNVKEADRAGERVAAAVKRLQKAADDMRAGYKELQSHMASRPKPTDKDFQKRFGAWSKRSGELANKLARLNQKLNESQKEVSQATVNFGNAQTKLNGEMRKLPR
jgi:uncharacterized protein YukE